MCKLAMDAAVWYHKRVTLPDATGRLEPLHRQYGRATRKQKWRD